MKDARLASFPTDAVRELEFMAKEFGLDGPRNPRPEFVGYVSGPWSIWAILEVRNKTVDTYVNYDAGHSVLRAPVWYLVRKAKLTGAGQPKNGALTRAGVQKSLAAQARALRLLLPLLLADGGTDLMGQ